jgi:hypothetical protein
MRVRARPRYTVSCGNLDPFLPVPLTLIGQVPAFGNPVYSAFAWYRNRQNHELIRPASRRADGFALARLLRDAPVKADDTLSAGDIRAATAKRLGAAHRLHPVRERRQRPGRRHPAMLAGIAPKPARGSDRGANVSHFHSFQSQRAVPSATG